MNKLPGKHWHYTALAIAVSGSAAAADLVELKTHDLLSNLRGQASVQNAAGAYNAVSATLQGGYDSFQTVMEDKTTRGEARERLQQTWRGLKVHGGDVIATRDQNGQYTFVTGHVLKNIDRDVHNAVPQINSKQALVSAWAHLRGVQGLATTGGKIRNRRQELVIYQDSTGHAKLAWKMSFDLLSGPHYSEPHFFIDAKNGKVLEMYEGLRTAEAQATGPGGNDRMGQIKHGNSASGVDGFMTVTKNSSTCTMENSKTRVVDLAHASETSTKTSPAISYSCTTSDNNHPEAVINGGYGPANDSLYNGTRTVEMYNTWFNVAPISCSSILIQRVHANNNLDNAFWSNCTMTYGDGNTFHPLTVMDVVGHEVSHGVTESRSGLQYSGQSGGMNESFSDIAGKALEYFIQGHNSWRIGDQIKKVSGQMRCMDTPTCDGHSIDNAGNYNSSLDVHYSSGVMNKADYLLATTSGWTTKKAFEVFYKANDKYWTSTATYSSAGEGLCKAAADLGYSQADVKAALNGVGINPTSCSGGGGGTDVTLTNNVAVTSQSYTQGQSTYYILDVPAGASNLVFSTSGGTGDVDMYVKAGSKPSGTTDSGVACKSEGANTNESCTVSSITTGKYYALVYGYSASSGVAVKGSYATGGGDGVPVLTNATPVSGLSFTASQQRHYKIVVPAGKSSLRFVTSGGTGDVDVYGNFGSKASTTVNVCKSEGATTAETCLINAPQAGTYYVMLNGWAASSGVTLTATYQ